MTGIAAIAFAAWACARWMAQAFGADCNGNGIPDHLEIRPLELEFDAPRVFEAGGEATALASADFDGDGLVDLAVSRFDPPSLEIFLGRGGWDFVPAPHLYSIGGEPGRLADADGDGVPDECAVGWRVPGDAEGDGALGISDAVSVLRFLFLGDERHVRALLGDPARGCVPIPGCPDACMR